jgi:hypothetical protein
MSLAFLPGAHRFFSRLLTFAAAATLLSSAVAAPQPASPAASRVTLVTRLPQALEGAVDAGPMPSSQRLSLTLTLAPTTAQAAALDQFLTSVTTASSPSYHQWLTPQQFAASYGASADRIAAASAWLQAQGLSVDAVSASGMRISASGFVSQVESAFTVSLHNYQVAGGLYFANATQPSLTPEVASLFSSVEGLDNLPMDIVTGASGGTARPGTRINGQPSALTVAAIAAAIDGNTTPILTIHATYGAGESSPSRISGYAALFRQAAAQGITTLLTRTAVSGGFPSTLPEVTAVAVPDDNADLSTPVAARPQWQNAPGLPQDGLRHAPDLTASSLSVFAQTISSIAGTNGGRLGNINPTLYALAPVAGIYTQPDAAAEGAWEVRTGLGLVDPVKLAKAWPNGTGSTTLQLTSSASSPTHGQGFVLTATETSTTGGPTPTGTVTFTAPQTGFTSSTLTLNASGVAQTASLVLPGGSYAITATYSGDANYASATATISVTVQPEAAVFTITAPPTVSLGGTITATVTLGSASGVGTPSASVTVTPSGIAGAQAVTQTVSGTGGTASATYTFTSKGAGSVALQASCTSNDASFTCYTPQTSTTTVPQATPSVSLSITPSAPVAGQSVTLSAPVTGVAGIGATGTVQFFDGSTSIGTGSAPAATFSGTLAPGSNHVLTAVYQGDTNYLKATSNTVSPSVGTAPTTTTVSASATTASYGQTITLNITVGATSVVNGTQPTGTLTFTGAGGTTTAAVSGGSANVTLTNLSVGAYTIGTTYSGDTNYSASTGNTVTLTVTQAAATLNSQISSASFTQGSTSTLTTTITLPGNAVLPTGSTFVATIAGVTGAVYTGTFMVNTGGNTGTGSVTIPAPIAGTYTLQVTCGPSTNFSCTANNLTITSTATTPGSGSTGTTPTTTTLVISPTAPAVGQTITFTATVSAAASAVATNPIAGSVNFYDGTTLLGTGVITTVGTNGVATATATLAASTTAHSLTAVYQGNTIYATSTSTAIPVTLTAAVATVVLSSNVTSTISGSNVVLTATVTGSTTTGTAPTGTVSFYLAGSTPSLIGTATVGTTGNGVGTAVFSTSNLPDGSLTIYATYNGDTNFSSATSNNITIGLSDYAISFVPPTLTLAQGQTGTATAVLTFVNSFPGTVVLGCTPPPSTYITCSFNPTVLTAAGNSTLTVVTTAAKTAELHGMPGDTPGKSFGFAGGATLAALLCCLLPARRRRVPVLLLLLLAFGLTMNMGCSANNFGTYPASSAAGGTPLGTTLLVIDTAGTNGATTIRHNYTFQVTVQ